MFLGKMMRTFLNLVQLRAALAVLVSRCVGNAIEQRKCVEDQPDEEVQRCFGKDVNTMLSCKNFQGTQLVVDYGLHCNIRSKTPI